jgi:A/G-specific adenine glycosylase
MKKVLRSAVLNWYKENGRDLPWRQTTDPYRIMVAEIMLQQTQVSRVLPTYSEWLTQFPTVKHLAQASTADVIRAWAGLGYNRRAIYLQKAAIAIDALPSFPTEYAALINLPGIGSYTAAAIMSFAYNTDIALVDTNVKRIYQLLILGDTAEPTVKEIRLIAEEYLPAGHSRDWHNALMDIGTIISKERGAKAQQDRLVELFPILRSYNLPVVSDRPLKRPKQSNFKQSRRFWRGQIISLLRTNPSTKWKDLEVAFKDSPYEIDLLVRDLEKDGLVIRVGKLVSLP